VKKLKEEKMPKTKFLHGFLVFILIFSFVLFIGCAKPPTKEVESAEKAIAEAEQKEADLYVQDVFHKAEDSLKKAKDLIAVKKYKEARKAAEDAASFAQQAIPMVELNKAKMKAEAEQIVQEVQGGMDEVKSLVAKAIKKKSPINREEIQGMIGKWEVDLVGVKEQLEAQKVRQAYDQLILIKGQITSQKESLTSALEQKPATKK
jgi:tetratricopeptide (TPR) repeat protein